jgi:hypothetical protein
MRKGRYGTAARLLLERFLIGTVIAFAFASCGGAPAPSPYDQDCSSTTCNGHMMPNNVGIGY